jgi:gamma-carbonic anhydrase
MRRVGCRRRLVDMVNVHPDAWVSPHAILNGEVTVGAGSRVLDLAVVHAVNGPVVIGSDVVVMEHAVLRAGPSIRS